MMIPLLLETLPLQKIREMTVEMVGEVSFVLRGVIRTISTKTYTNLPVPRPKRLLTGAEASGSNFRCILSCANRTSHGDMRDCGESPDHD